MQIEILLACDHMEGDFKNFELSNIYFESTYKETFYSEWSFMRFFANENRKGFLYKGCLEHFYLCKIDEETGILYKQAKIENPTIILNSIEDSKIKVIEFNYRGCLFNNLRIEKVVATEDDFKKVFTLNKQEEQVTHQILFK